MVLVSKGLKSLAKSVRPDGRARKLVAWAMLVSPPAFAAGAESRDGTAATRHKLNVLFIISHDLNNSPGSYGHPVARTPNIDRLAQRGVRFDRAYCQYPLCNPSRTSFLSGLRPDSTQVFNNDVNPQTKLPRAVLLPEYFQKHGYYTACIGKVAHYPRFA